VQAAAEEKAQSGEDAAAALEAAAEDAYEVSQNLPHRGFLDDAAQLLSKAQQLAGGMGPVAPELTAATGEMCTLNDQTAHPGGTRCCLECQSPKCLVIGIEAQLEHS
jgi:hypothetical protein